jgi:hypothetical protein
LAAAASLLVSATTWTLAPIPGATLSAGNETTGF